MHIDTKRLERALAHLRGLDGAATSVEALLHDVTDSVTTLFGVSGAGLLLADADAVVHPVLATDQQGWALEAGQEEAGEGPCIDSVLYGELVCCSDVTRDERWPALAAELADAGIGGVLGVPIRLGGTPVGALNVYADGPHEWSDSEVDALRGYGRFVESVLASALLAERRDVLAAQLQEALDARVVIERAIGLLMGRHDVDAVAAFNLLRARARPERRRVADVAQELLDGTRPPPPSG